MTQQMSLLADKLLSSIVLARFILFDSFHYMSGLEYYKEDNPGATESKLMFMSNKELIKLRCIASGLDADTACKNARSRADALLHAAAAALG